VPLAIIDPFRRDVNQVCEWWTSMLRFLCIQARDRRSVNARSTCCEGMKNNSSRSLQRKMELLLVAARQDANTVVDELEIEQKMRR